MSIIEQLIPLADAHQKADEYISGRYQWNNGACAVGCSIHDLKKMGVLNDVGPGDHAALAQATGVPEILWILSDKIFEGLSSTNRSGWTPRFLRLINKSTNLLNASTRIMARIAERLSQDAIRDDVAAEQWWQWCADITCEEIERTKS